MKTASQSVKHTWPNLKYKNYRKKVLYGLNQLLDNNKLFMTTINYIFFQLQNHHLKINNQIQILALSIKSAGINFQSVVRDDIKNG